MEFILVLFLLALLCRVVRWFFHARRASLAQKVLDAQGGDRFPRGGAARWYKKGDRLAAGGLEIPGGMVYAGGRLLDYTGFNDPSLINPALSVSGADGKREAGGPCMPLFYGRMTPAQRGRYLSWLAGGRNDPAISIAYVFLFFYGLERRLLVDGQRGHVSPSERTDLISEIRRLRTFYGNSRSFRGYANNLLAMEWALCGDKSSVPDYIDFTDRFSAEPFAAVLAGHAKREAPIPADDALGWIVLHPEKGLRTPARRCPEVFRELFRKRYGEKFGAGLVIHSSRTSLKLEYRGATPSFENRLRFVVPDLPNPFVLSLPGNKISALAEECASELDACSRFLSEGGRPDSPEALALLPGDLPPVPPSSERRSGGGDGVPYSDLPDERHLRLFHELRERQTWERQELVSACQEKGLIPDGALEALNSWSRASVFAPLADDGDPVFIDLAVAAELLRKLPS